MAWNPSPQVAIARDFGKKFEYSHVLIIGINPKTDALGIVTYGETKKLCADADKMGQKIAEFIESGGIGYF